MASADGYLLGTIMHEICHGLGPAFAHDASGEKVDIRAAIGPIFGGLEEAKADVVGMFALKWLVDHAVLPKQKLNGYYASYLAGNFRTLRFGIQLLRRAGGSAARCIRKVLSGFRKNARRDCEPC
jgi:hypothetical protein